MVQPQENGNIDPDILKCRDDIMRTRETGKNGDFLTPKEEESNKAPVDPKNHITESSRFAVNTGEKIEKFVIPAFDLKEQILSEQRKNSSTARKGPGQKKPEADYGIEPIRDLSGVKKDNAENRTKIERRLEARPEIRGNETDRIIAEIVAKDIERLCGGIS
ncbi:MAG: hypothetical protein E4H40_06470 [Candidatus Brocadiia bacterium]|nr:MAG: hypothetical protein E4H40_06470 [Candidatus Brocadiia bacterium]